MIKGKRKTEMKMKNGKRVVSPCPNKKKAKPGYTSHDN